MAPLGAHVSLSAFEICQTFHPYLILLLFIRNCVICELFFFDRLKELSKTQTK